MRLRVTESQTRRRRLRRRCSSGIGEARPSRASSATRRVLELLGDPQRAYPIIHVTGTNGKTSTSRMIESILRAYGLRTGLFTSPHLDAVHRAHHDRRRADREPGVRRRTGTTSARIVDMVDAELDAAGDAPLTFFEALTVLAFVALRRRPGRRRGARGRHGRRVGLDERRRRPGRRVHADRPRPHAAPRLDRRRDRAHEVGHHQAGRATSSRPQQVPDGRGRARARGRAHARRRSRSRATTFALESSTRRRRRPAHHACADSPARYADSTCRSTAPTRARTPRSRSPRSSRSSAAAPSRSIGDVLAEGLATGDLARPAAARRHRTDRARGCRAQPARRAGARRGADARTSTSTSRASCSACSHDKDAAGIIAALAPLADALPRHRSPSRSARSTTTSSPTRAREHARGRDRTSRDARARRCGDAPGVGRRRRRRAVVVTGSIMLVGEAIALAAPRTGRVSDDAGGRAPQAASHPAPESLRRSCSAFEAIVVFFVDALGLRAQGAAGPVRVRRGSGRSSCCCVLVRACAAALPVGHLARLGAAGRARRDRAHPVPIMFFDRRHFRRHVDLCYDQGPRSTRKPLAAEPTPDGD